MFSDANDLTRILEEEPSENNLKFRHKGSQKIAKLSTEQNKIFVELDNEDGTKSMLSVQPSKNGGVDYK